MEIEVLTKPVSYAIHIFFFLEFKKTENKVNCCLANNVIKASNGGPGEMAQLVKSTCTLAEDWSLAPRTHTAQQLQGFLQRHTHAHACTRMHARTHTHACIWGRGRDREKETK